MSLQEAVKRQLIDGKTVTILDPTNGQKVDLEEALESGVMDGTTGQVKAGTVPSIIMNNLIALFHCF